MNARQNHYPIPAGAGVSIRVSANQTVRLINSEGGQVVDTWVFNADDASEYLSMEHSRSALYKLWFRPADELVTNKFNPILRINADTSPGMHDTLHAACSEGSYRFYGKGDNHPNCQDNLIAELEEHNFASTAIPCPWNLFEHALVNSDMTLSDLPASVRKGEYVELTMLMDVLLVCSACPSTVGGISGRAPTGALIEFR